MGWRSADVHISLPPLSSYALELQEGRRQVRQADNRRRRVAGCLGQRHCSIAGVRTREASLTLGRFLCKRTLESNALRHKLWTPFDLESRGELSTFLCMHSQPSGAEVKLANLTDTGGVM